MAILTKRTSSKQLPDPKARTRAPLSSVVSGVGNTPNVTAGGAGSITSSAGSGTRPSLTTSTSGVPKQTLNMGSGSSGSTSSKVTNALSGAALGLGAKMLYDKVTGQPKISSGKGVPANSNPLKNALTSSLVNSATKAITNATKPAPKPAPKPPSITPPAGSSVPARPPAGSTTPAKPPVTLGSSWPSGYVSNGDGTATTVFDDGSTMTIDENMNPVHTTDAPDDGSVGGDDPYGDSWPSGYLSNGDGTATVTFDDGSTMTVDSDMNPVGTTDSQDFESQEPEPQEPQYFDDGSGNIYVMNPDGGFDLWRAAEVDDSYDDSEYYDYYNEDYSGEEYGFTDENGVQYDSDYNVIYDPYADNSDWDDYYYSNDDWAYNEYTDEDWLGLEDWYGKRGGLVAMMKNGGGVKGYANGGATQYFDDGSYIITYDDGSTETYDYDGELFNYSAPTYSSSGSDSTRTLGSSWPTGYVSNDDGTATTVFDDGSTMTIDENMNPVHTTDATDFISAGGGERPWYENLGSTLSSGLGSAVRLGSDALSSITGALGTNAGAAGAGALVATLLGQEFSGGTGAQNRGLDMSKVGLINPRTTDFGVGPTRFVGYEDYGTGVGQYTPNEELLRNLNAPGFNPVREGDYGYEEPAPATTPETPKMASGGLSSMKTPVASYYTFGQPADILANLGMRPQPPMNPPEMMAQIGQQQDPQQMQQEGLPQQMPQQMPQQTPQGMPQQGMMPQQQGMPPPMRKGGLPHRSNVPMVEGRMDFRRGAAVHGDGDGQSDDIPAMLADGEYVIDSETVAQIGNGSTKAGAQALDKFRESIRAHKRSAPVNKIPPKTKALTSYLKGAK